jgi:hypothetical protein
MATQQPAATALSRRRFVQTAALAAAGMGGSLAWPARSAAGHTRNDRSGAATVPPAPIPGGTPLPGGEVIHVWAPGDPGVTLPFSGQSPMGFDVDPSTITDFRGFAAGAFHAGTATDSDGRTYNLETDMRAFQGTYVGADGNRHSGSFAFI